MKSLSFIKSTFICALICIAFASNSQTVIGSGTLNKVPKFTVTGSTIGDSQISDNGTTVSLGTASVAIGTAAPTAGDFMTILKNQNALTRLRLTNGSAGTAAAANFYIGSVGSQLSLTSYNVSFTGSGMALPSTNVIDGLGTGGLNIGTSGNTQLSFWTNNTKRLTVTNTGSVGIGTSTPDKLLTVVSPVTNRQIGKFVDDARYIGLGRDEVAAFDLTGTIADLFLGGGNKLTVAATGNIGFGVTVPTEHLQIGDRFVFHDGGSKYLGYNSHFDGINNVRLVVDYSSLLGFANGDFSFSTAPSGAIGSVITATNRMIIKNTGEIGIGTATPNKKLTVVGDVAITSSAVNAFDIIDPSTSIVNFRVKNTGVVYAREVNVQLTTFPDYVFAKNYNLKTLKEVEQYIKVNHHLPNVPSAKEVESNGANLGELCKVQMEKIEELTLYLIEQQKQIEELKESIKSLKK